MQHSLSRNSSEAFSVEQDRYNRVLFMAHAMITMILGLVKIFNSKCTALQRTKHIYPIDIKTVVVL